MILKLNLVSHKNSLAQPLELPAAHKPSRVGGRLVPGFRGGPGRGRRAFTIIKKQLNEHYRVEADGSGPLGIVALRELVNSLPCAIRVLMLKVDQTKFPHLKETIRHDRRVVRGYP